MDLAQFVLGNELDKSMSNGADSKNNQVPRQDRLGLA